MKLLSCKDVSHLNSLRFDRALTLRERFLIWLHLKFCKTCTRVLAQLKFMRQAMRHYSSSAETTEHRYGDKEKN